jgi:hypothetical protein
MFDTIKEIGRISRHALAAAAAWAICGPILVVFSSTADALSHHYLPANGPDRLIVLTALTTVLIEVVRLSLARRALAQKLRDSENDLNLIRQRCQELKDAPTLNASASPTK